MSELDSVRTMMAESHERRVKTDALVVACLKLDRGCQCDYDYRCRMCSAILRVRELAKELT